MLASYDLRSSPQPASLPGTVDSEKAQPQSIIIQSSSSHNTSSNIRQRICAAWSNVKMPSFRQVFFTFLIAAFLTSAYARRPIHWRRPEISLSGPGDESAFQDLLSQVSDSSLHEVLHDVSDKYKHGVYPEDRTALQEIHKDNPAMATNLVKLARRQNVTVTTVDPVTSIDTVIVPTTETTSTVIVTVTPSDTNGLTTTAENPPGSQPSTQVSSNSPEPPPSASASVPVSVSVPPPPGSTAAPPQSSQANPSPTQGSTTPKTTDSGPGPGKTTGTSAAGHSSPVGAVSTSGSNSNPTTIPAGGSSAGKSSGPVTAQTSTTQQIIFTTTLPNGGRSTVTSFTIVPAGEQAATPGASASVTGTPSLQNSAMEIANPSGMRAMGAFLAFLVFVIGVL